MSVDMNKEMEKLGQLLEKNPQLMKAALSGMQAALVNELKATGLDKQVSPAVLQHLGRLNQIEDGGIGPVADDYVASAVSSVLHVVKVGVADLANNLDTISRLNAKINTQISKLNLVNPISTIDRIQR
jgi:hypothetical protein